ncbi:hypothetical protein MAELSTROM_65 [Pseudoalteromonas phage Maelstrom]|uniref:exonuclease VIII n=1 Tax=Pseudoalteromonas phage Maelstrom TaxID=2065202 RepID=UPI000CA277F6|nr:exonuclease VIII [Pseudoalteromonas phage Maelstrom]AUG84984.1 hypothetical protein MAELSTROM_65 [Pseudoalteromonas phage Maelstrom]
MTHKTNALTNDEYRSTPHFSNSDISLALQSTALLEWSKNAPTDGSKSVDLGTHIHCAMLEPDVFQSNYVKTPDFGTSAAGKRSAEQFKENMQGKIILDTATSDMINEMRKSILAHPVANKLLTSPGESEASIFSDLQGMKVKCRPDRIVDPSYFGGQHIVVDLKKTADIDKFKFSVRDFGYHRQAAFYSDIYFQLTGKRPRFPFIVVGEKRSIGRHPVRVFELPEEVIEIGRMQYLEGLEKCREYQEFGCGLDIEELDMGSLIR